MHHHSWFGVVIQIIIALPPPRLQQKGQQRHTPSGAKLRINYADIGKNRRKKAATASLASLAKIDEKKRDAAHMRHTLHARLQMKLMDDAPGRVIRLVMFKGREGERKEETKMT